MRQTRFAVLAYMLLVSGLASAANRDPYDGAQLRGRFTGNLTISERIPVDGNNTLAIEARQLLALTFDGKSGVTGIASVTAAIPAEPPTVFTCVFTIEGTYEVGDAGLGSADLAITPTTECAGPAMLDVTFLIGGKNRSRIDVTIDGARGAGPDAPMLAIVGSGTLAKD